MTSNYDATADVDNSALSDTGRVAPLISSRGWTDARLVSFYFLFSFFKVIIIFN